MKKCIKKFGASGYDYNIRPNKCTPGLNSSSRIIDVTYDYETDEFVLSYFESPFSDSLDIYIFYHVFEKDLTDEMYETVVGYTFYGRFYIESFGEYKLVFGKHVDKLIL